MTQFKDKIKLIVADVDGTLTDGGIYITEAGDEFKKFNTKDGMAAKKLIKEGFTLGIISASHGKTIVRKRAQMLGIKYCYVGNDPKIEVLEKWVDDLELSWEEVAFIGDDINDLEVLKKVGLSACPSDAVLKIKKVCDYVLESNGGDACFREFAEKCFSEI